MDITLRAMLFAGAVLTMAFFIRQIRKSCMQIEYAVYWVFFSGALVLLSIFPEIVIVGASLLHIDSPANLLYLVLIFALILKQFTTTIKISSMNRQITELTQHLALYEQEHDSSADFH